MRVVKGSDIIRKLLFCLLFGTPAAAGQPISESLAECHVIIDRYVGILNTTYPGARADALTTTLQPFADELLVDARRRADEEGRSSAIAYVNAVVARKHETWSNDRDLNPVLNSEVLDWIDYCRALAKNRGLNVPQG